MIARSRYNLSLAFIIVRELGGISIAVDIITRPPSNSRGEDQGEGFIGIVHCLHLGAFEAPVEVDSRAVLGDGQSVRRNSRAALWHDEAECAVLELEPIHVRVPWATSLHVRL